MSDLLNELVRAMGSRDERTCAHCGEPLSRRPGERRDDFEVRKFCNRDCYRQWVSTHQSVDTPSKTCEACGRPYPINRAGRQSRRSFDAQMYCTRSCRNTQTKITTGRYARRCRGCGAPLRKRTLRERRALYCSESCRQVWMDYVAEEVRFLGSTDTYAGLAARLGYSKVESMVRALKRHGEHDLAATVSREGCHTENPH